MRLGDALAAVSSRDWTNDTDQFLKALPNDWVRDSLVATGKQSIRNRKLPGHVVSWLVVGMSLFRTESIMAVMQKFDLLALVKTKAGSQPQEAPSSAAVVQARGRLGYQPLEDLFRRSASRWAKKNNTTNEWQTLQPYYIDEATITLAESDKNAETFGRGGTTGDEKAPPQVNMVALVSLHSDLLADAAVVLANQSKAELTSEMIDRLGPKTVLLADPQYISTERLIEIHHRGEDRHWISLANDAMAHTTKNELSPTDRIIELKLEVATMASDAPAQTATAALTELTAEVMEQNFAAAAEAPLDAPADVPAQAEPVETAPAAASASTVTLRELTVFDGKDTTRIWTSLVDAEKYSATEIAGLFRTQQEKLSEQELSGEKKPAELARSKKPDHALQEIWGLAVAYNLTKLIKPRAGKIRKKKEG
ncbi:MAG: IS4 family transposase [Myxococcales bacterium]|nr:IS4 family transposase [Myxococcales bacterium]